MKKSKNPSVSVRRTILRLVFLLLLPLIIFCESAYAQSGVVFTLLNLAGILFVIAGVLGRAWSVVYMGGRRGTEVFTAGPYSICRHPLYLFSTIGATGLGLMLGSLLMTGVMFIVTLASLTITARREEAFLRAEFGTDYDEYAAKVPMILPKTSLFHTPPEGVFNVRQLKINFFDGLVFVSIIPLITLLNWLKLHDIIPTFLVY